MIISTQLLLINLNKQDRKIKNYIHTFTQYIINITKMSEMRIFFLQIVNTTENDILCKI